MNNGSGFNYPKFANQLRGYAKDQVDMFIEDAADAYAELENENNKLRTKLAKSEAAVEKYRQTIDSCERMAEDAEADANRLVANAQAKSDNLISDAKLQSDAIIANARAKSEAMLTEAHEKSSVIMDTSRHDSENLRNTAEKDAAECVRHAREDAYKITTEARLASNEMNSKCTDTCRRIVAETLVKVASECEVMDALRRAVADYSAMLCDVYKDQLRNIAELASRAAELPAIGRETYENMANLGRIFGIDAKLPESLGICDDDVSMSEKTEAGSDEVTADVAEGASVQAVETTYNTLTDDLTKTPVVKTMQDVSDDTAVTDATPMHDDVLESDDKSNDDFYSDDVSANEGDDALADSSVKRVYGKDDRFISSVIAGGADIVRDDRFSNDGTSDVPNAEVPDEVARAAADELDNDMPLPDFFRREVKMKNRPMLKAKHHRRKNLFEDD